MVYETLASRKSFAVWLLGQIICNRDKVTAFGLRKQPVIKPLNQTICLYYKQRNECFVPLEAKKPRRCSRHIFFPFYKKLSMSRSVLEAAVEAAGRALIKRAHGQIARGAAELWFPVVRGPSVWPQPQCYCWRTLRLCEVLVCLKPFEEKNCSKHLLTKTWIRIQTPAKNKEELYTTILKAEAISLTQFFTSRRWRKAVKSMFFDVFSKWATAKL